MSCPEEYLKEYLGDAVYVRHDGAGLWLTTEDGYRATNSIYLEPEVWNALQAYVERLEQAVKDAALKEDI